MAVFAVQIQKYCRINKEKKKGEREAEKIGHETSATTNKHFNTFTRCSFVPLNFRLAL